MLLAYNILLWIAALFLIPYYGVKMAWTGKYRRGFSQRLGLIPPEALSLMKGTPRIWVHAVSVGEVTAAAPIIAALRERLPDTCLILSTTTDTGQEMARRIVTGANAFIYYPLDTAFAVRRAVDAVRPDVFVLTETELWPNFIRYCKDCGVQVVMVNGRLSPRSFRRYKLGRFFWKDVLEVMDGIGAISEMDAQRFRILGVSPRRLLVLGNAKYDGLASQVSPAIREDMEDRLNFLPPETVLVAGSTHEGEEETIIDVYGELLKTHRECRLIIAPRHVERAQAVRSLAKGRGFEDVIMMTEIAAGRKRRNERIVIVDLIGELFKVYSLATLVFCGGSLVRKGGQNILEAAAWGKVVFYGPFMDDFQEERAILEKAGAGITVQNGRELLEGILAMLADPEARAGQGEEGRRVVAANMGASRRYADLITSCLHSDFRGHDPYRGT